MTKKEDLLQKKILTPALWEHRIKVYEDTTPREVTRITIQYPQLGAEPPELNKENAENNKKGKWEKALTKMEFDINRM